MEVLDMNSEERTVEDYSASETANRYKKTKSTALDNIDQHWLQASLEQIERDGYVVIPNVLSPAEIDVISSAVSPHLARTGRNFFEGTLTQRMYSVIAKTFACNGLVEHPMILALLDKLMYPDYLLSQLQLINILPGEQQQATHYDDSQYAIPRPRRHLGAATIWALDDFTKENGATVIIPGSHKWGDKRPTDEDMAQQISCEMPRGSVVFFVGTLWHGGGANNSTQPRLAATAQYCDGFCRTQENFSLSIPPQRVAQCSEDMKRLLGYSIYGPFMGMVDGKHPKRLLEQYDK
jgi:ectoine hydroxylase-related dioxygenase (phytanoyl-CoA dioxygenase family)